MSHSLQAARTRRLIRQAFVELVDEKGFTEVTVSDIAARAMVDRATFYRHFRDKYHVAEQIFAEIAAEIPLDADPAAQDPTDRVRSWTRFFERFATHAKLFRPLLGRRGDPAFTAHLRELCVQVARRRLGTARRTCPLAGRTPSGIPEDLVLFLAANHIVATLSWWLEDGRHHTPEQMATTVVQFFSQGYFRALGLHDLPLGDRK